MTFNPLNAAREVLRTTSLSDPADVAEAVFGLTPPEAIPEAYRSLLRNVAREAMRMERATSDDREDTRRAPQPSAKVAAIRAMHDKWLRQRVCPNGDWKMLGDCTITDIQAIAEERREIAAKNEAVAKEFDTLADRMARQGVTYVRELDGAVE